MTKEELQKEIKDGVQFHCYIDENGEIIGVMGIQNKEDVTLIRHAYVIPSKRKKGIGSTLLKKLLEKVDTPIYTGTWNNADWAVKFYENNGFIKTSPSQSTILLKRYWKIPNRQINTSIVLKYTRTH